MWGCGVGELRCEGVTVCWSYNEWQIMCMTFGTIVLFKKTSNGKGSCVQFMGVLVCQSCSVWELQYGRGGVGVTLNGKPQFISLMAVFTFSTYSAFNDFFLFFPFFF